MLPSSTNLWVMGGATFIAIGIGFPTGQSRSKYSNAGLSPVFCPFPAFRLSHQADKSPEQIMAVARAGRRFRVVLHRKHRLVFQRETAIGAVEQGHMRLDGISRQARAVDGEAMVHGGDLDLAGGQVFHGMVGAVMAL